MIYEQKYPHANLGDIFEITITVGAPGPCAECGRETHFIDVCWEAHVCSEECVKILDEEFTAVLGEIEDYSDEFFDKLLENKAPSCNF